METKSCNFSVVSKGYCFLCLDKISYQVDITPSSVNSFQDISRYMKLDMRKVFIQGGPIPLHLLAKVEKSNLKVELCSGCSNLTHDISWRCRQLEKLKIVIEAGLESIHAKMLEADKTGRAEEFRKVVGSELDSGMGGGMEILEVLRMETKQKCSRRIKTALPRLQIQKLTTEEINRITLRGHNKQADTTSKLEQWDGSRERCDSIKMEEPVIANWAAENDDRQSENSFAEDLPPEIKESTSDSQSASNVVKPKFTNNEGIERKWTINLVTGKHKCQLCSTEYASRGAFDLHYNTVHRQLRIKCKICGKQFTQPGHYRRHHQSVHFGVRFQCKVCQKTYAQKNNLRAHQRKAGCGIGQEKTRIR